MGYGKCMKRFSLLIVLFALVAGFGWGQSGQPAEAQETFKRDRLAIVTADGARHPFRIEMATTPDLRTQGLQGRKGLAADAGMLFDFGRLQLVAMWMKNTFVSLDMIFIAGDGRIVKIAPKTTPESLAIIESSGLVKAVLEVRGGTSARLGIKPGDRIDHAIFR